MKRLSISVIALIAAQPLFAQEIVLDEITVTAETDQVELSRTGATVTVVTDEDLSATADTRVIDFLARLPGIGVITQGPIGTQTGFTIRGVSRNYVRVIVDGIDVGDPSAPQTSFDFGSLLTSNISRIEILRGAQSALYGSEAVGGVISITTKRPDQPGLTQAADFEAGSYGTVRANYGFGWRSERSEASFSLSRVVTDGFSAADEAAGNTEADGFDGTRLSFQLATLMESGVRVGLNGFVEDTTAEYDEDFPIADGSPDERTDNRTAGLRAFAEFNTDAVENTVALSWFKNERHALGSTAFGPDDNTYIGSRLSLSWNSGIDFGNETRLGLGADLTRETYDQTGSYGPGTGANTVAGIFAEYSASPTSSLDLAATLRYDHNSRFGGFVTGRVAAAWRAREDLIFRTQLGTGFRAPSNYELLGPFGDPTLKPEESRTVDFGVEKRLGEDGLLRATLFWTEVDNLIDFPTSSYLQVAGTVRRQGLELEADVALTERVRLAAAYTYTDANNPALSPGNTWNTNFGRHDLSVTLSADLTDKLSGVLAVQHVADRQGLPDYTVADVTLNYKVSDSADAYLRVENLFDEQYQLRSGYGTSDRAFYAGIRTRF